jgi:hypothetical protein
MLMVLEDGGRSAGATKPGSNVPADCAECGFNTPATPGELLRAIADAANRFCQAVPNEILAQAEVLRRRPRPGVWSALEYLVHTGDSVGWYEQRIRAVLAEPGARLEAFDWDAACEDRGYNDSDPSVALHSVTAASESLRDVLATLAATDWATVGVGSSDGGPRSVSVLAQRAAHEIQHHLLDIGRSLRPASTE